MPVRILEEHLINKIAAGEVVERPASVVKELVENALDARATTLGVHLRAGGRNLVRVVDDGVGMNRTDALMSLERHATSKIREDEDLFRVATLGFRGEAVPSIASVSRFELLTRPHEAEVGTRIKVEGGKLMDVAPAGAAPGTEVTVASLFFNLPARRKFLRSVDTELGHCLEAVTREALIRPDLDVEVTHDDRPLLRAAPARSRATRAADLLGPHGEALVPVSFTRGTLEVEALLSPVGVHRASPQGSSWLYVNGRFVRDLVLRRAVTAAYAGIVPKDRYPVVILEVRVPTEDVDVNVHPAKTEVRFVNGFALQNAVTEGLRVALREHGIRRPVAVESRYRAPEPARPQQIGLLHGGSLGLDTRAETAFAEGEPAAYGVARAGGEAPGSGDIGGGGGQGNGRPSGEIGGWRGEADVPLAGRLGSGSGSSGVDVGGGADSNAGRGVERGEGSSTRFPGGPAAFAEGGEGPPGGPGGEGGAGPGASEEVAPFWITGGPGVAGGAGLAAFGEGDAPSGIPGGPGGESARRAGVEGGAWPGASEEVVPSRITRGPGGESARPPGVDGGAGMTVSEEGVAPSRIAGGPGGESARPPGVKGGPVAFGDGAAPTRFTGGEGVAPERFRGGESLNGPLSRQRADGDPLDGIGYGAGQGEPGVAGDAASPLHGGGGGVRPAGEGRPGPGAGSRMAGTDGNARPDPARALQPGRVGPDSTSRTTEFSAPARPLPPSALLPVPRFRDLRVIGQLGATYLLCEGAGELVVIDQHAAHERVTLYRLTRDHRSALGPSQRLLVPRLIDLPPGRARLLAPKVDRLLPYGLEIAPLGGSTFAIQSVPTALAGADLAALLADVADELAEEGGPVSLIERLDLALATRACHTSVRAGQSLDEREMRALLASLDEVDFSVCAHGRPVAIRVSAGELERRFHRA